MNHPIADALTCTEKNHIISLLCIAIESNDKKPDMGRLLRDFMTIAGEIDDLAYGAPDDSAWPNYGEVNGPGDHIADAGEMVTT